MLQLLWIWMRDIETPTHHVFATHFYELFSPWKSTPGKAAKNPHCGGSYLNTGHDNYVTKRYRLSPFPDVLGFRKQFQQSTMAIKCFVHHSCSIIPPTLQSQTHSLSLNQQPFATLPSFAEHYWFLNGSSALETEIIPLVEFTQNVKRRNDE